MYIRGEVRILVFAKANILNQVCAAAGQQFLEIALVCVCLPQRALITSGKIWCDQTMCDWLNKFYGFSCFQLLLYMTLAVDKMDDCGPINAAYCKCMPKKTKVMWYQLQKDYPKDGALQL